MNNKIKLLVHSLIELSDNKRVIWNKTSAENQFKVVLESGAALTIDSWSNNRRDDYPNLDLCIYNDRGELILRDIVSVEENIDEYNLLEKLHNCAKNIYFKVDDTIDGMLEEIDSDRKIIGIEEKDVNPTDDDLPF